MTLPNWESKFCFCFGLGRKIVVAKQPFVMAPITLIEEMSPNGNIQAFVEQDERVTHFYLWGGPESDFGTKTCWIRNLEPGYDNQSQMVMDMRAGSPPMLDKNSCKHPEGAPPLVADDLRIVWFEEGDSAALLEKEDILAVIPCWSGQNGFHGYSRDCKKTSPICWPLDDALGTMQQRIAMAEEYWRSWENDLWPNMQQKFLSSYNSIGLYSNYYAIDGGEWPPKAMLQIPVKDGIALITLGVSLRPQPSIECAIDNPSPHRRIELGICLGPSFCSEEQIRKMASYISGQSGLPWANFTWLGEGHTIPCDSIEEGNKNLKSVLLTSNPPGAPDLQMPTFRGDNIKVLWLIPITDSERNLAVDQGSSALKERLWDFGYTWVCMPRSSVV